MENNQQDPLKAVKKSFVGGMAIAAFILPIVAVLALFRRS